MSKKEFTDIDYIYDFLIKKIKNHISHLKKLCRSVTIHFNNFNELGTNARGLTTEAIERFAPSF